MAALTALFNALALNLVMIVAVPAADHRAGRGQRRVRRAGPVGADGEDRVVRQFIVEFRAPLVRAGRCSAPGAPLGAVLLGGVESAISPARRR